MKTTFIVILLISAGLLSACKPPQDSSQGGTDQDVEARYIKGAAQQPSSNAIASNNIYLQGSDSKTAQDSKSSSSGITNPSAGSAAAAAGGSAEPRDFSPK